jgi:hypothetical protein
MVMLGWLRRLFKHTADTPPRVEPAFRPMGLEEPDEPAMLAQPLPPASPPISAPIAVAVGAMAIPSAVLDRVPSSSAPSAARAAPVSVRSFGEPIDDDVYGLTFVIEYEAALTAA